MKSFIVKEAKRISWMVAVLISISTYIIFMVEILLEYDEYTIWMGYDSVYYLTSALGDIWGLFLITYPIIRFIKNRIEDVYEGFETIND